MFNASDSDTVVPSTSQDSPDNRNSVDGASALENEVATTRTVIGFLNRDLTLSDLFICGLHRLRGHPVSE